MSLGATGNPCGAGGPSSKEEVRGQLDELARQVSRSAPLTEGGSADKSEEARERLALLNQACTRYSSSTEHQTA